MTPRSVFDLTIVPDVIDGREAKVVSKEASLAEVAASIESAGLGAAIVVDENGKAIGMISERDIIRVLRDGTRAETVKAGDVMESRLQFVSPEDPPLDVVELMVIRQIDRLPVVDNGKPIGIVTAFDLLKVAFRDSQEKTRQLHAAIFPNL